MTFEYGVKDLLNYRNRTTSEVGNGVGEVRQLVNEGVATAKRSPIYDELADGLHTAFTLIQMGSRRSQTGLKIWKYLVWDWRPAAECVAAITGGRRPNDERFL